MNARAAYLALVALALVAIAACWISHTRLAAAGARAEATARAAASAQRDSARLEALRAARPTVGQGAEPQADALALLNAALADASLPATHLRSLSPDASPHPSDTAPPGYQRRALRLTLGSLALPDLGRFLQSWRTTQNVWSISQIALRREPSPRNPSQDLWTATATLSATYLDADTARPTP